MCWWDIEKGVVDELATTDIVSLACSFNSGCLDNNSESCLRWLNILIRAGHRRQAEETITHLSKIYYEESWRWLDPVCDSLIERREMGLARKFLKLLPLTEPSRVASGATLLSLRSNDLLKAWEDEGASENEIDNWLAARSAVNYPFWMKTRCWFRARHGTEEELLKIIEGDVRIAPEDTAKAFLYLDAVSYSPNQPPVDWMGEVCKPRLARESLELGNRLKSRGANRAAISLLERSLATPITDVDIHLQGMAQQMVQMPLDIEETLRQRAIYSLIECYKQVGETGKAKQLLDDSLSKMKETKPHYRWLARMEGEMESQAGSERPTERELLSEEAEKAGSADYWRQRASYYIGKKDDAKVIEAYQKALELAKPQLSPCCTKCPMTLRGAILGDYWQYLAMNKRIEEAAGLLLKELREVPSEMQSAHAAACGLLRLGDYKNHYPLNPEEPVVWSYLEANNEWDYTENGLLRIMLKNAPEEKRDILANRAEALAQGAHPDRQAVVGNILSEMDMPVRAIPLLESAFRHMKKSGRDSCVAFTLFCAYLSMGEWNKAENMLSDIRAQMSPGMLMDYMGRLAISAAQAGAVRDAICLWHKRCNLDLTDFCGLDDLAQKGLRDTFRDYYLSLKKRDPESWVPDRALSMIH
jgi:tetratricopeptide (TPR) repeat protein